MILYKVDLFSDHRNPTIATTAVYDIIIPMFSSLKRGKGNFLMASIECTLFCVITVYSTYGTYAVHEFLLEMVKVKNLVIFSM